jgi:hypothetical protein
MTHQAWPIVLGLTACAFSASTALADPLTAALARMCRQEMVKAYPSQVAGSRRSAGIEKAQREYFRECVEKTSKKQN